MPEYYLSHQPRIIVAEIPSDDPPPEVPAPLEAEEWVKGWLITAPASPPRAREIMGGLAQVSGRLPGGTLILFPYDEFSVADVLANWLEAVETDAEMPQLIEEEVEDNAEAFRNLILGEKTLWRAVREALAPLPRGEAALQPVEAYEAALERALSDFQEAAGRGAGAMSPQALHAFSIRARRLLVTEKREALTKFFRSLAPP